jgi:hypothetical protein
VVFRGFVFFREKRKVWGRLGLVQSRIRRDDERHQFSDATVRNFRTLSLGSFELKVVSILLQY